MTNERNRKIEMKVLGSLIKWFKIKRKVNKGIYKELPPEYKPNIKENSKKEILNFIRGEIDGFLTCYQYVTGQLFSIKLDKAKYKKYGKFKYKKALRQAKKRLKELKEKDYED